MKKVYYYLGSLDPQTHGGPYCYTPFVDGVDGVVEKTEDPNEADLFFCGQVHDKDKWLLHPNRFKYFAGNEGKHVFDLDGDRWSDIPGWLRPCLISGMNFRKEHLPWRVTARPGSGPLLCKLATEPTTGFYPPTSRKLWFRGQRDAEGLRERLERIIEGMVVESEFQFNDFWGASNAAPSVDYAEQMRQSAFCLAPGGVNGGATLRIYEACYYGCIPIIVSDCLVAWETLTDTTFMVRISPLATDDEIAKILLRTCTMAESEMQDRCRLAAMYFDHIVRPYFRNPTRWFLTWMGKNRWY